MKNLIVILTGLLIAGGSRDASVGFAQNADPATRPTTAAAAGEAKRVVASGTIEPEEVVDVGAEVTGRIVKLGVDLHDPTRPIDYGSTVDVGTLLATIDPRSYVACLKREQAGCGRAKAELDLAKVNLKRAEAQWQRVRQKQKGGVSDLDVEQAQFDREAAQASVAAAEATVAQSMVAVDEAKIALENTIIKSPVKGVIIDRRINVGQVIPPNVTAASLFLIAKDLNKLQIWASVKEADIARIRVGQSVRFTVEAFPGKVFEGKVVQIRLNATMTQNVVTYTVVVTVSNSKEKLLPYLTANVVFQ